MNEAQVINKIGRDKWKEFCEFMKGQTVAVGKDGAPDYYEHDVERFMKGLPVVD